MSRSTLATLATDLQAQLNHLLAHVNQHSDRSSLAELLEPIARSVGAAGAIVWRSTPSHASLPTIDGGDLLIAASWFEGNKESRVRTIRTKGSVAGLALASTTPILVSSIWSDSRISIDDSFLRRVGITAIYAVPIQFDNQEHASVNYYLRDSSILSGHAYTQMRILASVLPYLERMIRQHMRMTLLQDIDGCLRGRAEEHGGTNAPLARNTLGEVCSLVSKKLNVFETSIYLRVAQPNQRDCELVATTGPLTSPGPDKRCRASSKSPTGWVIVHKRGAIIPDLRLLSADEKLRAHYGNMHWSESAELDKALGKGTGDAAQVLPHSFMATPILDGRKVIGAMRCLVSQRPPYHFNEADLTLLTLIAAAIGHHLSLSDARRLVASEKARLLTLVKRIGDLNGAVFSDLKKTEADDHGVFARTLAVVSDIIPDAFACDVRLLDPKQDALRFVALRGDAWQDGTEAEVKARKLRTFPVRGEAATSVGASVCRTGETVEVARGKGSGHDLSLFRDTKRILVAPIGLERETVGLLDIRRRGDEPSSEATQSMAALLGNQLGLYLQLGQQMRQQREVETELRERRRQESQVYQDLEHQLKSPIIQARARLDSAAGSAGPQEGDIRAARGLCGKAKRVVMNVRFFVALAAGASPELRNTRFESLRLYKAAVAACEDNLAMIERYRLIRFRVDKGSFGVFRTHAVYADWDLIEQAFSNILDNAFKYCYSNTVIEVRAGLTASDRAHVSFTNRGLGFSPSELSRCRERGFRGDEAQWTTGEGSGIGLYIVDEIMKIHDGGELLIIPQNESGRTEVKLLFSVARR